MAITREQVRYIADLARLELSDKDVEKFTGQLDDILNYIAKLEELDTEGIEITTHATAAGTVYREDVSHDSGVLEKALANAPDREGTAIRAPKVVS